VGVREVWRRDRAPAARGEGDAVRLRGSGRRGFEAASTVCESPSAAYARAQRGSRATARSRSDALVDRGRASTCSRSTPFRYAWYDSGAVVGRQASVALSVSVSRTRSARTSCSRAGVSSSKMSAALRSNVAAHTGTPAAVLTSCCSDADAVAGSRWIRPSSSACTPSARPTSRRSGYARRSAAPALLGVNGDSRQVAQAVDQGVRHPEPEESFWLPRSSALEREDRERTQLRELEAVGAPVPGEARPPPRRRSTAARASRRQRSAREAARRDGPRAIGRPPAALPACDPRPRARRQAPEQRLLPLRPRWGSDRRARAPSPGRSPRELGGQVGAGVARAWPCPCRAGSCSSRKVSASSGYRPLTMRLEQGTAERVNVGRGRRAPPLSSSGAITTGVPTAFRLRPAARDLGPGTEVHQDDASAPLRITLVVLTSP